MTPWVGVNITEVVSKSVVILCKRVILCQLEGVDNNAYMWQSKAPFELSWERLFKSSWGGGLPNIKLNTHLACSIGRGPSICSSAHPIYRNTPPDLFLDRLHFHYVHSRSSTSKRIHSPDISKLDCVWALPENNINKQIVGIKKK